MGARSTGSRTRGRTSPPLTKKQMIGLLDVGRLKPKEKQLREKVFGKK